MFMNVFQHLYAYLQYRYAVKKADIAHENNRVRYYVLPNARGKVRLIVTDRQNFRRLRLKHYIGENVKMAEVQMSCFYYTADASGKGAISDEMKSLRLMKYYDWVQKRLNRAKKERKEKRCARFEFFKRRLFKFSK